MMSSCVVSMTHATSPLLVLPLICNLVSELFENEYAYDADNPRDYQDAP